MRRPILLLFLCVGVVPSPSTIAQVSTHHTTLNIAYTGDVMANVAGGVRQDITYLDNLDLTVRADAEALIGWPGATLFAYGLGNQGGNPSTFIGDAQVANNIEAPTSWRLYEAWIQQVIGADRLSILAGLYDLNSEFDASTTGTLFINSSHGIGADFAQSGRNGPSIFPFTSLGVRLRTLLAGRLCLQAAVLDGVPGAPTDPTGTHIILDGDDGALVAAEVGLLATDGTATRTRYRHIRRTLGLEYHGKISIGGWTYTSDFKTLSDPRTRHPSRGLYVLADGTLYRESEDANQGLAMYARIGWADEHVNRFVMYTGAGAVYTGLLTGRPLDQVGAAVAAAHNGTPYMNAVRRAGRPVESSEVNLEFTYAASLAPWFLLQGDVQYIINPNTDPARANALVLGLRTVVSL